MTTPLTPAGSNRQYFRETHPDGSTYIRVEGTNRDENRAFITLARHFHAKGLPVPAIYSVSADGMAYTQEDLGSLSLFDFIRHGRETGTFSEEEQAMLRRTVRLLPHIQTEGAEGLDWQVCYPVPAFDRTSVFWDLNYFKYCYLKAALADVSEPALEADFNRLADRLLEFPICGFMYRDFQSRNIMLRDGMPYCIDFQGGRRGPVLYDLVSFLWQAKAHIPSSLRRSLTADYAAELATLLLSKEESFRFQVSGFKCDKADTLVALLADFLPHFVLFRLLQVLGAYGFRGYFERKPHFLQSIPAAVGSLRELFNDYPDLAAQYPTLAAVAAALDRESSKFQVSGFKSHVSGAADQKLHVTIWSFSYKRGIPEDTSGNGGGYVFDCRSTHNPGKYDEYKQLTGRDKPVTDFLEQDGEITVFLESVHRLTDHHIERFMERGFTHLQIAFGCTGGQHRSVYSAEATARRIQEKYHLPVTLIHRELGLQYELCESEVGNNYSSWNENK